MRLYWSFRNRSYKKPYGSTWQCMFYNICCTSVCLFWDRVLLRSSGCPGVHYLDLAGLKPVRVLQPLPLQYWSYRHEIPYPTVPEEGVGLSGVGVAGNWELLDMVVGNWTLVLSKSKKMLPTAKPSLQFPGFVFLFIILQQEKNNSQNSLNLSVSISWKIIFSVCTVVMKNCNWIYKEL